MIVCKRPCMVYDVDVIGLAALVAIALAAWFLVASPWRSTWSQYRELSAQRAATESQLQRDLRDLERFEEDLAQIRRATAQQAERAPHAASVSKLLRQMTNLAESADLELLSVAPQTTQRDGQYLVNEIQLAGRGRSRDFIRYLDHLSQEIPYQSLQMCSISRPATSVDPVCELAWSIRLYLLPDAPKPSAGGSS